MTISIYKDRRYAAAQTEYETSQIYTIKTQVVPRLLHGGEFFRKPVLKIQ